MNKDNDLTEDENSASFHFHFLAISSIINRMLSYYLLLCSFMLKDFIISHLLCISDHNCKIDCKIDCKNNCKINCKINCKNNCKINCKNNCKAK